MFQEAVLGGTFLLQNCPWPERRFSQWALQRAAGLFSPPVAFNPPLDLSAGSGSFFGLKTLGCCFLKGNDGRSPLAVSPANVTPHLQYLTC